MSQSPASHRSISVLTEQAVSSNPRLGFTPRVNISYMSVLKNQDSAALTMTHLSIVINRDGSPAYEHMRELATMLLQMSLWCLSFMHARILNLSVSVTSSLHINIVAVLDEWIRNWFSEELPLRLSRAPVLRVVQQHRPLHYAARTATEAINLRICDPRVGVWTHLSDKR